MKVELNTDKSPFLTIGPYSFTFGTPEHNVAVEELNDELKKQFVYNIRRSVLKLENKEDIQKLLDVETPDTPMPANVIPIRPTDVAQNMEDTIDKTVKILRGILKGTIPSVKKEAATLRLGSLRRLLELEQEGKNRKKLIEFFQKRLSAHRAEVVQAKGTEDMQPVDAVQVDTLSTQLSDIVESEEEQVLVPMEVLNELKTGA